MKKWRFFTTVMASVTVFLILGGAAPKHRITWDDLKCDWYEVELTHGAGGGFSPVYLPFPQKVGDRPETFSYAFSMLLSFKFDWVPDNISTRHPYFVYKIDRRRFKDYSKPNKDFVVEYASGWRATHVIGGRLVSSESGWGGQLDVYNREGMIILRKKYEPKFGYFELMGHMVIDWMAFRKQEVSEGLREELILPMTSDMKTVKFLETAAFVKVRSKDEWLIYDRILDIDPDFGEVRAWKANQMKWLDGDRKKADIERSIALESHLIVMALEEIYPTTLSNEEFKKKYYEEWLPRALQICPDNLDLIVAELFTERLRDWPMEKVNGMLELVQEHPYHGKFINTMAAIYYYKGIYEKAVPLYINALYSGYLWATNKPKELMYKRIIEGLEEKGELEKAEIFRDMGKRNFSQ